MAKEMLKKRLRICPCCYHRFGSVGSCSCNSISSQGELFERIRFGEERWPAQDDTCPTCGVVLGGYHHPGCDFEESPIPGLRLHGLEDDPLYTYSKVSQQRLDTAAQFGHNGACSEYAG